MNNDFELVCWRSPVGICSAYL